MSLHEDLLEQASTLARKETKRPKQASLRRAVSTAYYALFHLLTAEACRLVGGNIDIAKRLKMVRWMDHEEMKKVCGMFSGPDPPKDFSALMDAPPSEELRKVARTFVSLQNSRHTADYDLTKTYMRLEAQERIESVREAFAAWKLIKNSHEASVFAMALIARKLFEKQRT